MLVPGTGPVIAHPMIQKQWTLYCDSICIVCFFVLSDNCGSLKQR